MFSKSSRKRTFYWACAACFLTCGIMGATMLAGCDKHEEKIENPTILEFDVSSFEEFKNAIANDGAEKKIHIKESFDFSETVEVSNKSDKVLLDTSKEVTIKRAEGFEGVCVSVLEGTELSLEADGQGKIVFAGDEQTVTINPVFNNSGTLNLGENVCFDGFVGSKSGVVIYNKAGLNVNGAVFENNRLEGKNFYGIIYNAVGSTFNFNSGTFCKNHVSTTGALFVHDNVQATFNGGEIFQNGADEGGIIYVKSANVRFNHVKIHHNVGFRGTIELNNKAVAVVDGAEVTQNEAKRYAGAFMLESEAKLTVLDAKINENSSQNSGAAIFVDGYSTFIMNGGEICENRNEASNANGGAIINKSITIINGGRISGNFANSQGGAIYSYFGDETVNPNPKLTINGGMFSGNVSKTGNGGAINAATPVEVNGGKFVNNRIENGRGGAIYSTKETKISGAYFERNYSSNFGGAVLIENPQDGVSAQISDSTFKNNSSVENGGAIYVGTGSNTKISNCILSGNSSSTNGGAIYFVTNCTATVDGLALENNSAAQGGAMYAFSKNLTIKNTQVTNNTSSKSGGGLGLSETAVVTLENCKFTKNTAIGGGAIYSKAPNLKVVGGEFTENDAQSGGGGAFWLDTGSHTVLNGVYACANTSTYRGPDVYVQDSQGGANTPVLEINDGEFNHVGVQYAVAKIGGDVKINEHLTFHATKQAKYAYLEITKEISHPFKLTTHDNSCKKETASSSNALVRFSATDPWSNVYRMARKIEMVNGKDFNGAENCKLNENFVLNVVDGKILMQEKTHLVNVANEKMVIDAPTISAKEQTVSFKVFAGYEISNVKATYDDGTVKEVEIQNNDGTYSFTMPDFDVTISYDVEEVELPITVDENVKALIEDLPKFKINDQVNIVPKQQFEQKLTKIFVKNASSWQMDITDDLSFKMFNGATISGETKDYHNLSYENDEKILGVTFENLNNDLQRAFEGQDVGVKLNLNREGSLSRFVIKDVFFQDVEGNRTSLTLVRENSYSFKMPNFDVKLQFEFESILSEIVNLTVVKNEQELAAAFERGDKVVAVYGEIVLTKTISFEKGEIQLIGVDDAKIIRGENLKRSMFEASNNAILTLGIVDKPECQLVLDGGGDLSGIEGSIVMIANGGILNIYDGVQICNNHIKKNNFVFAELAYGNENCGGAGVFNHYGQVNMFGGEISNNSTIGSITGAGVFNYGSFNLYGGKIHHNTTENGNGAGIYCGKSLTLEGGSVENNSISEDGYGAGIYLATSKYAHMFMRDGQINENTSARSGAGLFVSSLSSCFINGGTFDGNKSTKYNGGAINSRGNLYVYGGTFKNNSAFETGGAIYHYIEKMAIHGGTFINNTAKNGGAVAFGDGAQVTIYGGEFSQNKASGRGGAMYLLGVKDSKNPTTVKLFDVKISDNTSGEGSAIAVQYAVLKLDATPTISGDIRFVANTTQDYGYVEFLSNFDDEASFTFTALSNDEFNLNNMLRAANGVVVEDLTKNIKFSDENLVLQVVDGKLVIKSVE